MIGQAVSEEKTFENGGRQRQQRPRRTPEHGYTISSPCEPNGSGELKSVITPFKRNNNAKTKRNNAYHNGFLRFSKGVIMRKKRNNALKMRFYAFQKALYNAKKA